MASVRPPSPQTSSPSLTPPAGSGVESMTFGYGPGAAPDGYSEEVLKTKEAEDCLIPMGITSENVAKDYNISRQTQDEFAAKSFQKAAAAQKAGKFKDEIVPLTVKFVNPKTEEEKTIVVDQDDGIRAGVMVCAGISNLQDFTNSLVVFIRFRSGRWYRHGYSPSLHLWCDRALRIRDLQGEEPSQSSSLIQGHE